MQRLECNNVCLHKVDSVHNKYACGSNVFYFVVITNMCKLFGFIVANLFPRVPFCH